jgi:putative methyltransferase (TIGR04325 family)
MNLGLKGVNKNDLTACKGEFPLLQIDSAANVGLILDSLRISGTTRKASQAVEIIRSLGYEPIIFVSNPCTEGVEELFDCEVISLYSFTNTEKYFFEISGILGKSPVLWNIDTAWFYASTNAFKRLNPSLELWDTVYLANHRRTRLSKKNQEIDGSYRDRDLLLVISAINSEEVKILDFGSGFANTFFYLKSNFKKHVNYMAVDLRQIVLTLNQIIRGHANFSACTFDRLPSENFDLVYFGSSLQYVEDYENVIIQICKLKAPLIFIADTPMGNTNTFVTVQVNMEKRRIPRWVFSKIEVIRLLESHGYTLVAESLVDWHQEIHNFDNFPTEYHQTRNRNLLFEHNS